MRGFDGTYYATVAQVIPVLFILIAFEARVVDFSEWTPKDPRWFLYYAASVMVGLALLAIIGEAAALRVLSERRVLDGADFLMVTTMASAASTLLVIPILEARMRLPTSERHRGAARMMRRVLLGLLALATVVAPVVSLCVAIAVVVF